MKPHLKSLILLRMKYIFTHTLWSDSYPYHCASCSNFIILGLFTCLEGLFWHMQVFYTSLLSNFMEQKRKLELWRWEFYRRPQTRWWEFGLEIRTSGHHPLLFLLYWMKIIADYPALSLEIRFFLAKFWQPPFPWLKCKELDEPINKKQHSQKAPIANLCYFDKLYLSSINPYCPREKKSRLPSISRLINQETSLGKYVLIKILSSERILHFLVFQHISWVFRFQLILHLYWMNCYEH